jgi:hypothetical protein
MRSVVTRFTSSSEARLLSAILKCGDGGWSELPLLSDRLPVRARSRAGGNIYKGRKPLLRNDFAARRESIFAQVPWIHSPLP